MRVRYTPWALAELDEILAYIAERSPQGARSVQRRLRTLVAVIADHPGIGQTTSVPGLRRAVALPYPYLLFYQVTDDEVIIIGVRHGARDPSTMPGSGA